MNPRTTSPLPLVTPSSTFPLSLRLAATGAALAALVVGASACSSPSTGASYGATAPAGDSTSPSSSGGTSTTPGDGTSSGSSSSSASDDAGAPSSSSGAADDASPDGYASDATADAWWTDAPSAPDASEVDAAVDADVDAGPLVNGCTAADFALHDESAAAGVRTITFANAAPATQYDPSCMRIATGQSVTWKGDLKLFPLDPFGGTTPSPIKKTDKGTTVTFTFAVAGTYGFESAAEAKVMFGAIEVAP
jgi:plastocyanin